MAIEWKTAFTIPVSTQLDAGNITNATQFAKLLANQYDLAVKTGMSLPPSVPSSFMYGNKAAFASVVERYLQLYNKRIFATNIKAQRDMVRLYINRVKLYKTILKDTKTQLKTIGNLQRNLTTLINSVKRDVNQVVARQIKSANEALAIIPLIPEAIGNPIALAVQRDAASIENILKISPKTLLNPLAITEKIQQLSSVINRMSIQVNSLIGFLAILDPIRIGQSLTIIGTSSNVDILSKYISSPIASISILAPYIRRLKLRINQFIDKIKIKINESLTTLRDKVSSPSNNQSSVSKTRAVQLIEFRKTISLRTRQIKTLVDKLRFHINSITSIVVESRMLLSEFRSIQREIKTSLSTLNQATGISIELQDIIANDFSKIPQSIRIFAVSVALANRISNLRLRLSSNNSKQRTLQQRVNGIKQQITEQKSRLTDFISKSTQQFQKFISLIATTKLIYNELLAKKRVYESYVYMARSLHKNYKQILNLKQLLNGLVLAIRASNGQVKAFQKIQAIKRSVNVLELINPSSNIADRITGKLTSITNDLVTIDALSKTLVNASIINEKRFGAIRKVTSMIDLIMIPIEDKLLSSRDKIINTIRSNGELIIQQRINPQSLSLTTAISLALSAYWSGGVWSTGTGSYNINSPGQSLFGLGQLLKNKPTVSSLPFLKELETAFRLHSLTITGNYIDTSSGTTVVWTGYN